MTEPIDLRKVRLKPIKERRNKVSVQLFGRLPEPKGKFKEYLDSLPRILKAQDLREICYAIIDAGKNSKPVVLMMGDALIKVGLTPYIMKLIEENLVSAIAMQGAGIIHDTEIALIGETSEDVAQSITDGSFGMWKETGEFINSAIKEGVDANLGLGEAVGKKIFDEKPPFYQYSIACFCFEKKIPLTVHVAYGTDTIHMHPSADGAIIGKATEIDFRKFIATVCGLEGGVVINAASAVILPEVFLKSLAVARNLGNKVEDFVAVNIDMIQHYRPIENVVKRPTAGKGKGYSLTGNLEILFPLLTACLIDLKEA